MPRNKRRAIAKSLELPLTEHFSLPVVEHPQGVYWVPLVRIANLSGVPSTNATRDIMSKVNGVVTVKMPIPGNNAPMVVVSLEDAAHIFRTLACCGYPDAQFVVDRLPKKAP